MRKLDQSTVSNLLFFGIIAAVCGFIFFTTPSHQERSNTACRDGWVNLPGSDFCFMRYEAQKDPNTGKAVSMPGNFPWNFQSPVGAKVACEELGRDYSLMTSDQWNAIAANILTTEINDLSEDEGKQLAVGNSAGLKRVQGVPGKPTTSESCSLSNSLDSETNKNCPLRNDGFSGTAGIWEVPYEAGLVNRSLLRTHTLSNGEVIWDFAGNLWEWMGDRYIFEDKTGSGDTFEIDRDGVTGDGIIPQTPVTKTDWIEHTWVASYGKLQGSNPPDSTLTSRNGIGKISLNPGWSWDDASNYTTPFKAVGRGGAWANNENSGIYSINLALGPSYSRNYTGFRCVKSLK